MSRAMPRHVTPDPYPLDDETETSVREEGLFRSWRKRVEAGLPEDLDDEGHRFALIQEIHDDQARRYPLGIAGTLRAVISALHVAEDVEAIELLEALERDEWSSRALNASSEAEAEPNLAVLSRLEQLELRLAELEEALGLGQSDTAPVQT